MDLGSAREREFRTFGTFASYGWVLCFRTDCPSWLLGLGFSRAPSAWEMHRILSACPVTMYSACAALKLTSPKGIWDAPCVQPTYQTDTLQLFPRSTGEIAFLLRKLSPFSSFFASTVFKNITIGLPWWLSGKESTC